MSKFLLTTCSLFAVLTGTAQAEIICTHHGGCHETGMKLIYGDGGGVNPITKLSTATGTERRNGSRSNERS